MNLPADASPDQSNCPPDYYRRLNGMLHQIGDTTPIQTDSNAITAEEAANLGDMSKEELIALVTRFACQCGIAAMMSDEETAQAMLDVLAETALRPIAPGLNMKADIKARMEAIDKWLDRKRGKPTQAIDVTAKVGIIEIVMEAARLRKTPVIDNQPIIAGHNIE